MSLHEALARLRIASPSNLSSSSLSLLQCSRSTRCRLDTHKTPATHSQVRHATHGIQGRANGPKNGPGKRLGAKKTGEQYVIPGNIIYRQRGTLWFPGENVGMGRDHTIFARETGYVKYYRDPMRHPDRKYIGVVFERNQTLPTPPNAARRRRLSMMAVPRLDALSEAAEDSVAIETTPAAPAPTKALSPAAAREARRLKASGRVPGAQLRLRPDYSYRESNYDIGRAAERAGVKAAPYKPGDRFSAWRKRGLRRQAAAEKRSMARKGGPKKSKK